MSRRAELAAALTAVRARIDAAARAVGRSPDEVTLVVVTKAYPASDVRELRDLGVVDFGENRVDELVAKAQAAGADMPHAQDAGAPVEARWHLIGQLQRNKVGRLAGVPNVVAVHSVDRQPLVQALARHRPPTGGPPLDCFVQVDLSARPTPGRGGARVADVAALADAVAAAACLRLAGLMTVAPLDRPPGEVFAELAELALRLRRDHPGARAISAGMSGDFEAAVANGATHLRVGTAILGPRPLLR